MQPIEYDFILSIVSLLGGIYVLVFTLKALNRQAYTPFVPAMITVTGILYWCVLALVSIGAIYHRPEFLDQAEWHGTWGYTIARVMNSACWAWTLVYIAIKSAKCRKESNFEV